MIRTYHFSKGHQYILVLVCVFNYYLSRAFTSIHTTKTCFRLAPSNIRMSSESVKVMINGMPGPMALETAKACIDRG